MWTLQCAARTLSQCTAHTHSSHIVAMHNVAWHPRAELRKRNARRSTATQRTAAGISFRIEKGGGAFAGAFISPITCGARNLGLREARCTEPLGTDYR